MVAPQDVAARAPAEDSAVAPLPGGELSPEVVVDDALPATATTEVQAAPTQAELDYAAIYGEPPYYPAYDDTLPAPAQMPQSYDPWEGLNRRVHTFNNVVDRTIAKPLAKAYAQVVPRPIRLCVSNFFPNLGPPISALNALLQGKPQQAAQPPGRFPLNRPLGNSPQDRRVGKE